MKHGNKKHQICHHLRQTLHAHECSFKKHELKAKYLDLQTVPWIRLKNEETRDEKLWSDTELVANRLKVREAERNSKNNLSIRRVHKGTSTWISLCRYVSASDTVLLLAEASNKNATKQ